MRGFLVVTLLLGSTAAHADPCAEGAAALKAKDVTRASITVEECLAVDAEAGAALQAKVDAAADKLGYSTIDVTTKPQGGTVIVDTVPDRPFVAPRQVWVASGYHEVSALADGEPVAGSAFRIGERTHAVVLIELPDPSKDHGVHEVDFTDGGDEPEIDHITGGPEDEKFKNLLPERYLRGVNAEGGETTAPRGGWWRIGFGVGMRTTTGAPGGGVFELERRGAVGGPWWVSGNVNVLIGYAPDSEMDEAGGLVLQLGGAALVQIAAPAGLRFGAGPSAAVVAAPFDGSGVTFGGTATAELARRWYTIGLRVDAPLFATDHHAVTGALLFGFRW